jgi:hypothetical protein
MAFPQVGERPGLVELPKMSYGPRKLRTFQSFHPVKEIAVGLLLT